MRDICSLSENIKLRFSNFKHKIFITILTNCKLYFLEFLKQPWCMKLYYKTITQNMWVKGNFQLFAQRFGILNCFFSKRMGLGSKKRWANFWKPTTSLQTDYDFKFPF